jgi:hypothetical protein
VKTPSSWLYVVTAALAAPLALAVTAFFSGLWQRPSTERPVPLDERQLGT